MSLFLGLIFSIIFTIFYIIYIINKSNKDNICKLKKEQHELLKNFLLLSNYEDIKKSIFPLYNLLDTKKISSNHYTFDNKDIFLFYENDILDNNHLISILKHRKTAHIEIYCINHNTNIEINNTTINFITIDDIYTLFNKLEIQIPNLHQDKQKTSIIQILKIILNKKRSKKYLLFGFFLIFASLFSPFTIYYTIIGTLLIFLSIYSRFNYRFNK